MKKRLGIIVGLLLAGVLGWLLWRNSGPIEPVFEGRALSTWLYHHVASSAALPPYNSPGWKKADEALRSIGSNAVPTLLKMIEAKAPPPAVVTVLQWAERHPWTRVHYRHPVWRNEEAEYAFEVLGTNAVSAVPGLIRIYEEDVSPSSQRCAALALGHIGHAVRNSRARLPGPGPQAALPALIRRFSHTNTDVRFYAVSAVMSIGGKPEVVVPALTGALKDPSVDVRWNALVGLSMFGGRARPAVPEILKMLNDPGKVGDSSIITQVETTLWRVAPEKVGKPLVVEDATLVISNGVTTAALKMVLFGERKTLIPRGKAVPAVAQYWNSDPRPRLALYRGAAEPGGEDHLLGHFVVLGLPESENLNVSTLCVVADGRIFLCARDNHQDQFLEIRRVSDEHVK